MNIRQDLTRFATAAVLAAVLAVSGPAGPGAQTVEVAFPPQATPLAVDPAAQELHIIVDFAAILHIEGGMSVVAVGNPAIANANLVNNRTVIVSGHLAGTTNVVILDDTGRILADVMVFVSAQKPGMIRERRGTQVRIHNCINGLCEVGPIEPLPLAAPLGDAAGS
jgi:Flp pilus assembly secretin CpaC